MELRCEDREMSLGIMWLNATYMCNLLLIAVCVAEYEKSSSSMRHRAIGYVVLVRV